MTRRKRNRSNGVVRITFIAVVLLLIWYIFRGAFNDFTLKVATRHYSDTSSIWSNFQYWEAFRIRAFDAIFTLWVFVVGASIGSFLNVVVYRLPRGESINRRGSHCPYCNQAIRFRDNLPVFGWINLGGRCHCCRLPISARYPIVEAVTGFAFVLLFWFETGSGGRYLPFATAIKNSSGILGYFGERAARERELMSMTAFHLFTCAVLWSGLLIERDRNRIPVARLLFIPLLIAVVCSCIWKHLQPVDWFVYLNINESIYNSEIAKRISGPIGLLVGAMLGYSIAYFIERDRKDKAEKRRYQISVAAGFAIVGVTFGWQAIMLIALPFVILLYYCRISAIQHESNAQYDFCSVLCVLTITHWIFWSWTHAPFESQFHGITFIASGVLAILLAALFNFPARSNDLTRPDQPLRISDSSLSKEDKDSFSVQARKTEEESEKNRA